MCDVLTASCSLTGITLVRGGDAVISLCDCAENGSDPFTIEDVDTMGSKVALNDNQFDSTSDKIRPLVPGAEQLWAISEEEEEEEDHVVS